MTENIASQGALHTGGNGFPARVMLTVAVLATLISFALLYWSGLDSLIGYWSREEYSHGPLIPLVAAYLIVRRLADTDQIQPDGRWYAIPVALLACLMGLLGTLSDIDDASQYGSIVALSAALVSVFGFKRTLMLWAPIIYLVFMIPLPEFLFLKLFAWAQLVSSEVGTFLVRLWGIPVFLEGNIIDLGIYKLQVAQACSGLRYLFPLMSFGFLVAIIYQGAMWERILIFLSTIPIAILMNSVRIGIISILVNSFGIEQAEGFIHYSEGWVVFIACLAILFAEASLFSFVRGGDLSPIAALDFGVERLGRGVAAFTKIRDGRPLLAVALMLAMTISAAKFLEHQPKIIPERTNFATFPADLGDWHGKPIALDQDILNVLSPDDYIVSTYLRSETGEAINLYVAYFEDQAKGAAPHSPEVCIPGAGWEIASLQNRNMKSPLAGGPDINLKRAIIQKGKVRQLVYFWFRERDRDISDEYKAKFLVLWDSLIRNRSDGALVRLSTPIKPGEKLEAADRRLTRFFTIVYPELEKFLPARDLPK